MYVIMSHNKDLPYHVDPKPIELAKTLQVAKDRCRTLNKQARSKQHWYTRIKPIIDASGTKADPAQISF